MDIVDWMQGMAWFACPMVAYILFFKDGDTNRRFHGQYSMTYWNYFLKKWWAYIQIKKVKPNDTAKNLPSREEEIQETPRRLVDEESVDGMSIFGIDQKGNKIQVKMTHKQLRTVEVWLMVQLDNGKVYQLPNHPDTVVHDNNLHTWSVGGLKMHMIEPMRKWRITFNGILRCGSRQAWSPDDSVDDHEHVRFSFIWSACSAPIDIQADWSAQLHSSALAREPWRDGEWKHLGKELGNGYEQWGTLYGTWMAGDSAVKVMHVRGIRQRLWGDDQAVWQHRRLTVVGVASDGLFFSLIASSSRHGLTHATFGHVRMPNGAQAPVDWTDLSLPNTGEYRDSIPPHMVVRFRAANKHYAAVIDMQTQHEATMYGGRPWDQEVKVRPFQCAINSHQAAGVAEFWYRYIGSCPDVAPHIGQVFRQTDVKPGPLVVSFEDKECQSSLIVGGKGSSLALMASYNDNELNVPPGFCLTVTALEMQLEQCKELNDAIMKLQKMSCGILKGDLKDQCEITVSLIESTPVCNGVAAAILQHLRLLDAALPLAVRSSGVGEDSEDLSAAGQNATMLGQKQDDILTAVTKCWASLYTFQSVQYRRQHGQEVACGMGVVVQVMVPAETAGVMFTRHPITGDPSQVLITANYGLGESVVSALVEPDTVILSRDWKNKLSIKDMECGSKAHKIDIAADGGVTTIDLKSEEVSKLCISTEEALALGQLGVRLEAMFDGPRDIEWAIVKGRIHLLQARPITSLDSWSDFDLLHEHDSPMVTDDDVVTIANTGEVFPGAVCPLTESWVVQALDQSVVEGTASEVEGRSQCYYLRNVITSHHHVMLNFLNTMMSSPESEITIGNKVMDLAIFGHLVTTPELHSLGKERNGVMGSSKKMKVMYLMLKDAYRNSQAVKEAKELCEEFQLDGESFTNAAELYAEITKSFHYIYELSKRHGHTSRVSTFTQLIAMSVLMEGQEEFTADHMSDISVLLSSCSNVISAGIPTDLKALSESIASTGLGAEFASQPDGSALQWLEEHSTESAVTLRDFLVRHGHRGIREFDLMTETWGMKPETVIKTLQAMAGANASHQEHATIQTNQNEKTTQLKSPKKSGTKMVLKWLMSWCQMSVARREDTKASLIAVVHCCRKAFRRLGELLLAEGRIPNADLVFFFTHYELGLILKTRDPVLLAKATRRMRLWPQWDKLSFPEIICGLPAPLTVNSSVNLSSTLRLQGTAVCQGTVMGRACVILNLDEISILQPGDILITHSTDIGWSPYFPLLGGVVTELGGLISHGAVVAREYGLPCIVGAQSATSIFQTGDTVLLVGSTGTLEKIVETDQK